ncbi:S24/S26 family peptidase [Enterococcus faecalis]|uniref:S24/S26 family peptidase n=1 Tax=Enterococcus faecalis TaxID=1351 RepID=UPI0036E86026
MRFVAEGVSMLPTYKEGDILVAQCSNFEISTGKIVVIKSLYNNFFAHRVVSIGEGLAICKGDNFKYFDPPVRTNSIVGVIEDQADDSYVKEKIKIRAIYSNEKISDNFNILVLSKNLLREIHLENLMNFEVPVDSEESCIYYRYLSNNLPKNQNDFFNKFDSIFSI